PLEACSVTGTTAALLFAQKSAARRSALCLTDMTDVKPVEPRWEMRNCSPVGIVEATCTGSPQPGHQNADSLVAAGCIGDAYAHPRTPSVITGKRILLGVIWQSTS